MRFCFKFVYRIPIIKKGSDYASDPVKKKIKSFFGIKKLSGADMEIRHYIARFAGHYQDKKQDLIITLRKIVNTEKLPMPKHFGIIPFNCSYLK